VWRMALDLCLLLHMYVGRTDVAANGAAVHRRWPFERWSPLALILGGEETVCLGLNGFGYPLFIHVINL
jgi:hypothetical protein